MAKALCRDGLGREYSFEEGEFIDRRAVYGVYIEGGRVLLVRDATSSFWELPGGGIDHGEGIQEALSREFLEESGLRIQDHATLIASFTELFYDLTSREPWKTERSFYVVDCAVGEIKSDGNNDDVSSVAMFDRDVLRHYKIRDNIRSVLASAFQKSLQKNIRHSQLQG